MNEKIKKLLKQYWNLDFQANEKRMFIKRFKLSGGNPVFYLAIVKIFNTTTSVSRTVEKIIECFQILKSMNLLAEHCFYI